MPNIFPLSQTNFLFFKMPWFYSAIRKQSVHCLDTGVLWHREGKGEYIVDIDVRTYVRKLRILDRMCKDLFYYANLRAVALILMTPLGQIVRTQV